MARVTRETVIAPSLLAADQSRLAEEVRAAEDAGADWLQVDVMDGHFVPNLTMGVPTVECLRPVTDSLIDVHLMVEEPSAFLGRFAEAGADLMTVHQEACPHLHRELSEIHRLGCRAGVALNPGTPVEAIRDVLPLADLVLIMTVNPGFGGQSFIHSALKKVRRVREMAAELELDERLHVQVDGGVDAETAPLAADAGADVLVAGSSVFRGAGTVQENLRALRAAAA